MQAEYNSLIKVTDAGIQWDEERIFEIRSISTGRIFVAERHLGTPPHSATGRFDTAHPPNSPFASGASLNALSYPPVITAQVVRHSGRYRRGVLCMPTT